MSYGKVFLALLALVGLGCASAPHGHEHPSSPATAGVYGSPLREIASEEASVPDQIQLTPASRNLLLSPKFVQGMWGVYFYGGTAESSTAGRGTRARILTAQEVSHTLTSRNPTIKEFCALILKNAPKTAMNLSKGLVFQMDRVASSIESGYVFQGDAGASGPLTLQCVKLPNVANAAEVTRESVLAAKSEVNLQMMSRHLGQYFSVDIAPTR